MKVEVVVLELKNAFFLFFYSDFLFNGETRLGCKRQLKCKHSKEVM